MVKVVCCQYLVKSRSLTMDVILYLIVPSLGHVHFRYIYPPLDVDFLAIIVPSFFVNRSILYPILNPCHYANIAGILIVMEASICRGLEDLCQYLKLNVILDPHRECIHFGHMTVS